MHIFTIHSFLSLSWAEWGSILVIGTAVFGGAHKLIGNLIDKVLNPINQNLQNLTRILKTGMNGTNTPIKNLKMAINTLFAMMNN